MVYTYERHGTRRYCKLCRNHRVHNAELFPDEYNALLKTPYEHDTDRTCTPEQLKSIPQMTNLEWGMYWHSRQRNPALRDWALWFYDRIPPNPNPVRFDAVLHYAQHTNQSALDYIFH